MNRNHQYFVLLALTLTVVAIFFGQTPSEVSFDEWAAQFPQQSTLTGNDYRRMVFQVNYADILAHNANPFRSFDKGLNQFSHLTAEQFRQMYVGLSISTTSSVAQSKRIFTNLQTSLGDVDWGTLGKISPVKNQGNCDAGYAFCSVGLTESSYLFAATTVILSEQQIIDCAANYTTFGCQGGSRNGTLNYIRQQGLNIQSLYPFKGAKGVCLKNAGNYKLPKRVEALGCDAMRNALENSPLTVAVNALEWMTYRSGIFDNCSSTEVNHDVLLVGATLYNWRIKNSWGVKWGEYGYIRLKLGNTCGICLNPAFGFQ